MRRFNSITLREFMTAEELVQQHQFRELSAAIVGGITRTSDEETRSSLVMDLSAANETWFEFELRIERRVLGLDPPG